jgi:hypothetical protein
MCAALATCGVAPSSSLNRRHRSAPRNTVFVLAAPVSAPMRASKIATTLQELAASYVLARHQVQLDVGPVSH